MVDHCCAIGCQNTREKKKGVSNQIYRIPKASKNKEQKELWIKNIRRANWPQKKIDNARICSDHFISGKSNLMIIIF